MAKNIVCIDLDDTLADTYSEVISLAQKYDTETLGGTGIFDKSIDSEDYYYFARMLGWDRNDVTSFFEKYYPQYLKIIAPKNDAKRVLKKLKKIGLSIHIITSRRKSDKEDVLNITKNWLTENEIVYDDLTIDAIDKDQVVNKVNGKYFLDDSLKNCEVVRTNCPKTKVFLLNTNYNSNLNANGIKRVSNLEEFYREVEKIEKHDN